MSDSLYKSEAVRRRARRTSPTISSALSRSDRSSSWGLRGAWPVVLAPQLVLATMLTLAPSAVTAAPPQQDDSGSANKDEKKSAKKPAKKSSSSTDAKNGQQRKSRTQKQDRPRKTSGRKNGKKVIELDDNEFEIFGKLEKPSAFYVLQRSSTDHDWSRIDAKFTPLVLESVQDPLF